MKKISAFILFGTIFAVLSAQENPISPESTASMNEDMQAAQPVSSGMLMEQAFEKYRQERNIAAYGTPNTRGTTYFTGQSTVTANVNSPDFIKSRSVAFMRAYQNAITQMVMDRVGREVTTTLAEEFSDNSTNAEEKPEENGSSAPVILRKIGALSEAALDKALRKMDVDPAEYADKSVEVRKDLFKNALIKRAVRTAVDNASGCLPVQTFESRSSDGTYTIGVVLRFDADCKEIARCIAAKKRPLITRSNGLTIEQALPDDEELLTQFGVRLFFDESGSPSLLSFGQYGSAYTGNNSRQRERAMEHAFRQAENIANQQLTEFINSTVSLEESSDIGEEEVARIFFLADGTKVREELTNCIDRFSSRSKTVGYDTMVGRSTVCRRTLTHPAGHQVAVVVRRWSFAKLDAELNIQQQEEKAKKTEFRKEDSGVRQGRTYDF